jgi:hypothetical protein
MYRQRDRPQPISNKRRLNPMIDAELEARFAEMQEQLDQLYSFNGRQDLTKQRQAAAKAGPNHVSTNKRGHAVVNEHAPK